MAKQTIIKVQDFGKTVKILEIKNAAGVYQIEKEIGKENSYKYLNKRFSYVKEGTRVSIKGHNGVEFGIGVGQEIEKEKFEELMEVMRRAGQRFMNFKKKVHKTIKI